MLVRLVYASTASPRITSRDLFHLAESAERNNTNVAVTGALLFANRYFLQILEGERDDLMRLYRRIASDPRHCDVRLVEFAEIKQRAFPEWAMRLLVGPSCAESPSDRIKELTGLDEFLPYRMSATQCKRLIYEVARTSNVEVLPSHEVDAPAATA